MYDIQEWLKDIGAFVCLCVLVPIVMFIAYAFTG